jgi:tetratricopeptide (TPR) repeat protein
MTRALAAALTAAFLSAASVKAADPFYTALLRDGKETARRSPAEAVAAFRVASFGLLDDPALLTEALVRLAVAQRAAGREADAQATAQRFADVEGKFHAYTKASLEPEIRSQFEEILGRRLPGEMARAPSPPASSPPAPAPPSAPEAPPAGSAIVRLAREALERGDLRAAMRYAGRALDEDPNSDEALAIRARALTQRESYRAALADLRRLPSARFEAEPELWADLFVCLVATRERAEARSVAANVPRSAGSRQDVSNARRTLFGF